MPLSPCALGLWGVLSRDPISLAWIGVDGYTSLIISVWFFGGATVLILGIIGVTIATILAEVNFWLVHDLCGLSIRGLEAGRCGARSGRLRQESAAVASDGVLAAVSDYYGWEVCLSVMVRRLRGVDWRDAASQRCATSVPPLVGGRS